MRAWTRDASLLEVSTVETPAGSRNCYTVIVPLQNSAAEEVPLRLDLTERQSGPVSYGITLSTVQSLDYAPCTSANPSRG